MIIRIFFATILCAVGLVLLLVGGFCGFITLSANESLILLFLYPLFFSFMFLFGAFFILKSSKRRVLDDQNISADKKNDKLEESNTLRIFFIIILGVCSFWSLVLGGLCSLIISPSTKNFDFILFVVVPLIFSLIFFLLAKWVSKSSRMGGKKDFYDSIREKNLHIINHDDNSTRKKE